MSIEVVQMFQTPDGKKFATEAEAVAHMNAEQYGGEVDQFLSETGPWRRGRDTMARNTLTRFLAWRDLQAA